MKLGATQITDSGIEKLEPYLIGNTTLKLLYLAEAFRISEKSTPILVNVVNSSQIYEINITGTYIGNKSPIAVALACNCIKYGSDTINLSTKGIDEDDLVTIYNCMKKYGIEHLKDINLYKNNMTSKTASLLFDTLRECNSVVSRINVSLNKLDDACMHSLGELIQDNEYLEQLAINGNQITDKGIEILSEYLMGNTTLKELGLSYCLGITDTSIPLLIQVIKSTYIESLHIDFGVISSEQQQEARDALLIPIDQRQIPIKSNTKSAAKSFASIKA